LTPHTQTTVSFHPSRRDRSTRSMKLPLKPLCHGFTAESITLSTTITGSQAVNVLVKRFRIE